MGELMYFNPDSLDAAFGDDFPHYFPTESNNNSFPGTMIPTSNSSNSLCAFEAKQQGPSPNGYMQGFEQANSSPILLDFSSPRQKSRWKKRSKCCEEEAIVDLFLNIDEDEEKPTAPKKTSGRVRLPSQTYDHIIAERKRREQLSQLFVSLSAIVPGLKKMDKTSVLGDGIKYLKQLQERVKELEKQTTTQTMESVVLVRKSQLVVDEDHDEGEDSSDEKPLANYSDLLPEIEARVSDRSVLIRIHCEKHRGVLAKILSELEKLNLFVTNTSVIPFGRLTFEITIIAEMENEFNCTTKGVVRTLREALGRVGPGEAL